MTDSSNAGAPFAGLHLGVAYYPEYHRTPRTDRDLSLMSDAGITVIRVGESVWSTWEPRDGDFHLEWLTPVLDAAHARGIRVILGTPTYAVPPWLQVSHPELAGERRTGQRIPWGARQEVDYTHPAFQFYAERVIRQILDRHATHPAVIGFQVDNEPGLELFHNHAVFTRFVRWLKARYTDVATLNEAWGLTYWSHRIDDWAELWRPDGNTFPQYDLAWRTFQAEQTRDFIRWQVQIVDDYRRPEQFVTTCLQYPRRGLDERTVTEPLDVAAGNPYYGVQDHLEIGATKKQPNYWTTTGVPGLIRQADRIWASRQARYLVTETNAQSIGTIDETLPPYPGQLRQIAWTFVSRGAAMIEYWHWHSLPYGAETYWGGVLPHSLEPGRIYTEISQIGADFAAAGVTLDGYRPQADVTLLWSTPSRFALQFQPPFQTDGQADEESYEHLIDAFHRGVVDSGRQARILHVEQAERLVLDSGVEALVRDHPILVAAGTHCLSDAQLAILRQYARAGGHLILTPRSAYADEEARARVATAPAGLDGAAGARYEEFSVIDAEVPVRSSHPALSLTEDASARWWIDGLITTGAQELARYQHPRFGDFPAITTHEFGAGRVTTVGCVPSPALAAALIEWAAPPPLASALITTSAPAITITSGELPTGAVVVTVSNWGWGSAEVRLERAARDLLDTTKHHDGEQVKLDGWGVRVFVFQPGS
ncbi:beta-galactosidase [Kineococcus aurantiacus]|uniref:beta-galactosidase n=1 Tax=Kineococcus aurantiacus TaxID=37633 RepID=A0A7Y9J390_9ACTN|nr:beta-galactosidase [Kineococcus aurantiacus]NYD25102.1 beta-galactosidase [Kineococcus aurantiacus]